MQYIKGEYLLTLTMYYNIFAIYFLQSDELSYKIVSFQT